MLHLFRSIRQGLINEGKTSKYFRYAFGEIVLIVVGILIALQIQNWNEERRFLKQEQKTLLNLKAEFQKNHDAISIQLGDLDQKFPIVVRLYNQFGTDVEKLDAVEVEKLVDNIWVDFWRWQIGQGVYLEELNSGRISSIKSDELKSLLADWVAVKDRALEYKEHFLNFQTTLFEFTIEDFPWKNVDIYHPDYKDINTQRTKLPGDGRKLLQSLQFENLVNNQIYYTLLFRKYFKAVADHCEKMTTAIDTELNQ